MLSQTFREKAFLRQRYMLTQRFEEKAWGCYRKILYLKTLGEGEIKTCCKAAGFETSGQVRQACACDRPEKNTGCNISFGQVKGQSSGQVREAYNPCKEVNLFGAVRDSFTIPDCALFFSWDIGYKEKLERALLSARSFFT